MLCVHPPRHLFEMCVVVVVVVAAAGVYALCVLIINARQLPFSIKICIFYARESTPNVSPDIAAMN